LAGGLLGGVLMYSWGVRDLTAARSMLVRLPGVDFALLDLARHQLQAFGVLALFKGALGGVPYKIYAIQAAAEGVGLMLFLAVSVFARWLRFALVIVATRWIVRALFSGYALPIQRRWLIAGWLVFYVIYFTWLTR
jgi:membrane protein YqaA with SNARE-associated domain